MWEKSQLWLLISPILYMYMLQTQNLEDLLFSHRPTYARKQGLPAPLEIFGCALIVIMNTCMLSTPDMRDTQMYIHTCIHTHFLRYDNRISCLAPKHLALNLILTPVYV